MSKPLYFIVGCFGAFLLLTGYLNIVSLETGGQTKLFFGLLLILIGGFGYRRKNGW